MIDKTISHYKILEKLGEGGMGVVYKAEDTRLKRSVALKFLPPELTRNSEAKKRFFLEAQAASSLEHTNICNIHEIDETDDGQTFIVMACYEGETLKEKLKDGCLSFEETMTIGSQIASGLLRAHEKGIIHRDIKPANIFITQEGVVKIVDFGLAKLVHQEQLTQTGSVPGTAMYMSPEQTQGASVDQRTDIWSLGVVLYEMLSGEVPFKGDYEQAVIYSILNENPRPLNEIRKDIPSELEQIIDQCLCKDPADRYVSATALLDALMIQGGKPFRKYKRSILFSPDHRIRRSALFPVLLLFVVAVAIFISFPNKLGQSWLPWSGIPSQKHLAVLPFMNIGELEANQAFCDGFVELVTSKLTQLEELKGSLWVVPSAEVRRRGITSADEAKKEFGVNLAVTGSIQRNADRMLLTLNLVDANSLRQLRSIVLDDNMSNISLMQSGVVVRLADMLKIEVQPGKMDAIQAGATPSPEAYDFYIQGRGLLIDYQELERMNEAIEAFQRSLAVDAKFALAHAGLGEAFLRKFRITKDIPCIQKAVDQCHQSLDLNDRLAPVRLTLGLIHTELGQYEDAVHEFLKVIEMDLMHADAYTGLARAYDLLGNSDQAEEVYQRAIQLRPNFWSGYSHLGVFYFQSGRYEEAVTQFQRVVELTPENIRAYTNLGGLYFTMEQWDEAETAFEHSLQIKPNYRAYHNLGTLYYYSGRYADAAEMYEKALSVSDLDYRVWAALGASHNEIEGHSDKSFKNYRQAIALAEAQLEVNPRDVDVLSDLAGYYAMIQEKGRSTMLLDRVIALDPENLEVLFRIAETYEMLAERDLALHWLEIILNKGYHLTRVLKSSIFLDIQSDARFQRLLEMSARDSTKTRE